MASPIYLYIHVNVNTLRRQYVKIVPARTMTTRQPVDALPSPDGIRATPIVRRARPLDCPKGMPPGRSPARTPAAAKFLVQNFWGRNSRFFLLRRSRIREPAAEAASVSGRAGSTRTTADLEKGTSATIRGRLARRRIAQGAAHDGRGRDQRTAIFAAWAVGNDDRSASTAGRAGLRACVSPVLPCVVPVHEPRARVPEREPGHQSYNDGADEAWVDHDPVVGKFD
jgi:hypothetical protein